MIYQLNDKDINELGTSLAQFIHTLHKENAKPLIARLFSEVL